MRWRKVLWSTAFISGGALVIGLFFRVAEYRGFGSPIYTGPYIVNGVRNYFPLNTFSKFFVFLMLIVMVIGFASLMEGVNPSSKRDFWGALRSMLLPPGIEAILVTLFSWVVCLPLSLFLWGAPFAEYIELYFWIVPFAYFICTPITIIACACLLLLLRSVNNRFLVPYHVNLTGLETSKVIEVMGWPLREISIDSKVIYVYQNAKVIIIDGRVTDVQ
jgi:hypothetical protein